MGVAVTAATLVFLSTSAPGPGLDPDSMAYMGAASSLARDGRLRVPTAAWNRADSTSSLSLWPPGFPALIALPVALGANPVQAARWINIFAAAATAGVLALIVAAPLGTWAGIVAVVVAFATQAVFDTHLSVLSEPVFIAVMLLVLAAMIHARDRLLLLGALATAAVMLRYAGVSALAAVVLWTLLDGRRELRVRCRRALGAAVLPMLFIVIWFTRTATASDRHATPQLHLYGDWGATLLGARDALAEWLAPLLPDGALQRVIALLVALALASFIVAAAVDTGGDRLHRPRVSGVASILGASSAMGGCYLIVVLGSRAFIGGTIPLDWRILSPLIIVLEIMSVASIAFWWRAYHLPLHATFAVFGLVWLVAAATVTANDAVYAATVGSDFAALSWRQSPLIAWVRTHGTGRPLYSNWPPALYFHAHRVARELPDSLVPGAVAGFGKRIGANHGYVVGFDERSPDFISPAVLAARIGLRQVVRVADGAVWTADSVASPDSVPVGAATPDSGVPQRPR